MSEKIRDPKNRWRNETVAFRVSREEAQDIEDRVKLCGYRTKREYLADAAINQKIIAKGNPMMIVQFRRDIQRIEARLMELNGIEEMEEELLTPIRTMLEIMEAFAENEKQKKQENKKACATAIAKAVELSTR